MVVRMRKLAPVALAFAAVACSNQDNVILNDPSQSAGTTATGIDWPNVLFTDINSSIGSEIALFDPAGNPTGERAWVVIMSDLPGLCTALRNNRSFFRQAPRPFEALVLFLPVGRVGSFIPGRPGDEGTSSEIIAADKPQPTAPFHVFPTFQQFNDISLVDWNNGAAQGNFDLFYTQPDGVRILQYAGNFKTSACDGLDGVLLP
jgi:hypothetical protein